MISDRNQGSASLPNVCKPMVTTDSMCSQCGKHRGLAPEKPAKREGVQSYIFSLAGFVAVEVFSRVCTCGNTLCYDGKEDAVFNLDSVNLFSYELLRW